MWWSVVHSTGAAEQYGRGPLQQCACAHSGMQCCWVQGPERTAFWSEYKARWSCAWLQAAGRGHAVGTGASVVVSKQPQKCFSVWIVRMCDLAYTASICSATQNPCRLLPKGALERTDAKQWCDKIQHSVVTKKLPATGTKRDFPWTDKWVFTTLSGG